MTTLQLEEANTSDILKILRETRTIWSGGLSPDKCIQSIHNQLTHPWGKKHLRYLLLRSGNEIVASLKFYSICITSRAKTFNFAGLGAIYTMERYRNQGYGAKLVRAATDLAKEQKLDGLLLFSDIDAGFYANLDFLELSNLNFELAPKAACDFTAHVNALKTEYVPSLSLSYDRFLSRRSYGCRRSDIFWRYKIHRENFFHNFSEKEWPGIQLVTLADPTEPFTSYALIETSSTTQRVLEVVGSETQLWDQLIALAHQKGLNRVRGFESSLPPDSIKCQLVEREWAIPMILPLNSETKKWLTAQPCPLLELDHF